MKKLFILLTLAGMFTTACEKNGTYEPTDNPTEKPDEGAGNNTPTDKAEPIKFIDSTVKTICVVNWDTNGDAELSYEEAAAVTDIGTTFKGADILSFIELAYFTGVSDIANEAFAGCSSLKHVELPHNITSIGGHAFLDCKSLTSIAIPSSVTEIGEDCFDKCTSMGRVDITDVAAWCEIRFKGWYSNPLIMAHNLYINGAMATDLTIPDSATTIGHFAFYGCTSLASVTIGNGAKTIGSSAFNGCTTLKNVTLSSSVTSIGDNAFNYCTSLASITIPESITKIGSHAFSGCGSLTSVTIPNSVTTIGDNVFSSCDSLTTATIGNGIASVEDGMFRGCTSLIDITIPESITTIGNSTFRNCSSLTSVTIPERVTQIGNNAFCGCSSLTSVYCEPTTPPTAIANDLGWYAFDDNASDRKIYVPTDSVVAYMSSEHWSDYMLSIVGYDINE